MRLSKIVLVTLLFFGATVVANADTIDFVADANTMERGEPVSGYVIPLTFGTLTVTAGDAIGAAHPYLDAGFGGLGACSTLDGGFQCNPSSDDNATSGDSVIFTFNVATTISGILMNNNHDGDRSLLGDTMTIGGALYMFADGGPGLNSSVAGSYTVGAGVPFVILNQNEADNDKEFYVSEITVTHAPEPGTVAMVGLGLIGVGLASRRRNLR